MHREDGDSERLKEDPEPYPAKAPEGSINLTEEQLEEQLTAKQLGQEWLEDGDYEKALKSFTEAITIGNASAMLYAKRADVLLKLKRPCACISDCDAAIEINPNSAKAYGIRGVANRKLGRWALAHKDLSLSQQLDFKDDLVEVHDFVTEQLKRSANQDTSRNWTVDQAHISDDDEDGQDQDEQCEPPDDRDVMEEDPEPYPEKGPDLDEDLTVMQSRKQQEIHQRAMRALQKGSFRKALEIFTEAIGMGNPSAAMYAKRAEALLKLGRPCACISDCGFALEINPDSVKALRVRGKAYAKLARWEDAHKDISTSQQLDFDDELIDLQSSISQKFRNIQEEQRQKRLRDEQCFEENLIRRRKAHEERVKAEEEAKEAEARAKAERSLWRRCVRCSRRLRGKGPVDANPAPAAAEEHSSEDMD